MCTYHPVERVVAAVADINADLAVASLEHRVPSVALLHAPHRLLGRSAWAWEAPQLLLQSPLADSEHDSEQLVRDACPLGNL